MREFWHGQYIWGAPVELTLEEALPTASADQLAELRSQMIPSTRLRVVSIDQKKGEMTIEAVAIRQEKKVDGQN